MNGLMGELINGCGTCIQTGKDQDDADCSLHFAGLWDRQSRSVDLTTQGAVTPEADRTYLDGRADRINLVWTPAIPQVCHPYLAPIP